MHAIFDWFRRRRLIAVDVERPQAGAARPPMRAMTGKYLLLYKYLENRYANSVVLTFAQIEDLVGFPLPDQARCQREWWTDADGAQAGPSYADAWKLASRTASPNLLAKIVAFDRAS
jgi:hypothetical protein